MTDKLSPENRSLNMSKIRSKDTSIELKIRKILFKGGYRYRLHKKEISGKPDLYLQKYKTAIFINGCFWHRHELCKTTNIPKSNVEFWTNKFNKNIDRDNKIYMELNNQNIKVIIIWECTINKIGKEKDVNQFLIEFRNALKNKSLLIEI